MQDIWVCTRLEPWLSVTHLLVLPCSFLDRHKDLLHCELETAKTQDFTFISLLYKIANITKVELLMLQFTKSIKYNLSLRAILKEEFILPLHAKIKFATKIV